MNAFARLENEVMTKQAAPIARLARAGGSSAIRKLLGMFKQAPMTPPRGWERSLAPHPPKSTAPAPPRSLAPHPPKSTAPAPPRSVAPTPPPSPPSSRSKSAFAQLGKVATTIALSPSDSRDRRDKRNMKRRHMLLALKQAVKGGVVGGAVGAIGAAANEGGLDAKGGAITGSIAGALAGGAYGGVEGGIKRSLGMDPILETVATTPS